jgi:hypothetical protein
MSPLLQEKAALYIEDSKYNKTFHFFELVKKKIAQEINEIHHFNDLFKRDGRSSIFLRAFIKLKCEKWLNCLINDEKVQESLIKANNLSETSSPETVADFSSAFYLSFSRLLPEMPRMLNDIFVFLKAECTQKFAENVKDIDSFVSFQFVNKIILPCYECSPQTLVKQDRILNSFISKINEPN